MVQKEETSLTDFDEDAASILVVEDDRDDAEFIVRVLQSGGRAPRVKHVNGGMEALDYLAWLRTYALQSPYVFPKFILLDLHLNRMQGMHVLRTLKSDARTQRIP